MKILLKDDHELNNNFTKHFDVDIYIYYDANGRGKVESNVLYRAPNSCFH